MRFLLVVFAVGVCAGFILLGIYPYRPASVIGWLVLFMLAVPVVVGFEWLGKSVIADPPKRIQVRWVRVGYGPIAVITVIIVSSLLVIGAQPFLVKW